MSYLLVETYGTNDRTVVLDGRTYPLDCLIEDDLGLRWYLAPSFQDMHAPTWARAAAAGAVALATPADGGWRVLSTELFLQVRTEAEHHYALEYGWGNWAFLPGYPTLMSFERDDRQVTEEVFGSPDDPPRGFVHLHTHTEYSALDGRSRISEIVGQVLRHGQEAVSDTDHGNCSGHPRLQRECEKARIKPIFGMEAWFVHDRLRRGRQWWVDAEGHEVPDERVSSMTVKERNGALTQHSDAKEVLNGYFHVTLLALDDIGLRNVWAMSTEGFRDGFYGRPRIDWDTLRRHAEGVICLTGCIRGPLAVPIIDGDQAVAQERLGQLLDIFGDRLYLEVMPNAMEEQVKVNRTLASLSTQYGVPLVATVDSHYPTDEAQFEHRTWVALRTNADVDDETSLFAHDLALYVQGEREVRERLLDSLQPDEIDEAVANTVRIARRCTARIESKVLTPVFSKQGGPERDAERLLDLCLSNWHLTTGKSYTQDEAMARFEREFALIVDKDFCGYFLQVADYVNAAKQAGCRVGPGRGSGGGSLVAYTARITGLDPIEGGLLFERFLTEGREGLPDFDVDFPSTWRDWVQDYITGKYGEEHVVRVGTHLRLRNKGIVADLFRVMKSRLPETAWRDAEAISAIIGAAEASTAGIGLSWEELWAQEEEVLQPYAEAYPEVMDLAGKMVGLLKSYGKHPAGLVVSETSLVDSLPLRSSEDEGRMITQFEMGDLEKMGYIKFDILTLRTLDTIQETLDLIKANRGIWIDVDNWKDEYLDPQVWEDLADGHTLGVFQVETSSGTRLMRRLRPGNLNEFADVLTLVRPGPKRSGLQDLYIRRRDGLEEVTYADPRLEPVLSKTYGTMLYQEDIMATCMVLAGYDSAKADEVRSILGKKKVELVVPAGREFVEGCVANGMDRGAAEHLWEQMAEFARYSFNRAHAFGYAVLAYWTAWLKVHYPVEFFTSVLSTVKAERIPEFVTEARRMGFSILPPDINESRENFTAHGLAVRYGLEAIKGVGVAASRTILAAQPYASFEDFQTRSGADRGVQATLARIGALDSLVPNRRGLETLLLREKTGEATACVRKDVSVSGPNGLPCTFDWSTEPVPINPRTQKALKPKPVPKRCTRACRQYLAPPPFDPDSATPYTEDDIREIEMEVLGLHLSSSVFDRIPEDQRAICVKQAEAIEHGPEDAYILAATVAKVRRHTDRTGQDMAFVGLVTERNDLDVVCFAKTWARYKANIRVGSLLVVDVQKNSRGLSLSALLPVM